MKNPERRDAGPAAAERLEGLRYTFVEDDDEHGPYFKILEGETLVAYAVRRAAALQITRALNREDLRLFARRAKVETTGPVVSKTPARPTPAKSLPPRKRGVRKIAQRRFRSKRKL